jgi:hypothetical protein
MLNLLIIKAALISGLIDFPAVMQSYITEFVTTEKFNRLFEVDNPFEEEANIGLLFYLISALVYTSIEGKALPFFCRFVKECDDAVKHINREPKDVELVAIEFRALLVIVDEKFASDFELVGILVESPQTVEKQ